MSFSHTFKPTPFKFDASKMSAAFLAFCMTLALAQTNETSASNSTVPPNPSPNPSNSSSLMSGKEGMSDTMWVFLIVLGAVGICCCAKWMCNVLDGNRRNYGGYRAM